MDKLKKLTLNQLYEAEKAKPTPAQVWLEEVAQAVGRNVQTVRMWLMGRQRPDKLVAMVLGRRFGVDPESLFPAETTKSKKKWKTASQDS